MSERRGSKDDKKGGSGNSTQTSGGWVPFKPLPSPQKRRWSETGNQSEIPKQLCSTPPFQDGGNSSIERHHETRGLDDESRPKRCIFLSTNMSRGQEISPLQMEKQDISVQLPTFWSVMCSLGLYQDNQGSGGNPKEHGHSSYHIHRRHTDNSRDRVTGEGSDSSPLIPSGEPGICDQLPKIPTKTNPDDRLPGLHSRFSADGAETPRTKDTEYQSGYQEAEISRDSLSAGTIQIPGEVERHDSGDRNSAAILQAPTRESTNNLESERPELQGHNDPYHTSQGRAPMVVYTPYQLEWEEPHIPETPTDFGNRCLPTGMGSDVRGSHNRRALVERGAEPPHKLPRTLGSLPGSEMLRQRQEKHHHTTEDGQHHCNSIHKQARRNSISTSEPAHKRSLAVVHGERYISESTTSPRYSKYHSRCRVPEYGGQNRLEVVPPSLQDDQPGARPTGSGPICLETDITATRLCQLETRSRSDCAGCIHNGLVSMERVCQSTMELDRQGAGTDKTPKSQTGDSHTSLELTSMVPNIAGDADRHPKADSPEGESDSTITPRSDARCDTPASHVDYLRGRYRECQLSEEASKLLLASWREKSSKSYDSLFRKWLSWCNERNSDPVSGPIGEVVNFLADLFKKGYQYRSLNAYRSAISSVHDKADGYEVGQHPLVTRLLKGAYHQRPPQPRYSYTWRVDQVTSYINDLGENDKLSLSDLTAKTVMLLALSRPSRSADLANLDI